MVLRDLLPTPYFFKERGALHHGKPSSEKSSNVAAPHVQQLVGMTSAAAEQSETHEKVIE